MRPSPCGSVTLSKEQDELRKWIKQHLDDTGLFNYATLTPLSDQMVELAKANQHRLTDT